MGTIVIEEYGSVGSDADREAPVPDLNTILATTVDATTSTSAGDEPLTNGTRVIGVYAVEDHRVSIGSDTTDSVYAFIPAGQRRDFGVEAGDTLYYRLNA